MSLHFFHTMALALWVGGSVAIGILVAPAAFSEAPTRAVAGRIVGRSLQRFDRVVMLCIVALILTSVLLIQWYGRWSAWYAIEYTCIILMSASALFSMLVLSPRLRRLRPQQQAATEEDGDPSLAAGAGQYGEEFDRLHRLSVVAMQFNLACGTIAILFS
jgi:uncharacterized membrane protein